MKKVSLKLPLEDKHSNLLGFHFRIPKNVADNFTEGKNKRVVATFNHSVKNHCAIMPSPKGPFIKLNKSIVKELNIQVGDVVTIELEKDTSTYGTPISEEFEAVIFSDAAVFNYFQALTPGKQRNLIHLVNKIKNTDIKINRSMAIAQHLMDVKGMLDFKQLNETIKEYNQKHKLI